MSCAVGRSHSSSPRATKRPSGSDESGSDDYDGVNPAEAKRLKRKASQRQPANVSYANPSAAAVTAAPKPTAPLAATHVPQPSASASTGFLWWSPSAAQRSAA